VEWCTHIENLRDEPSPLITGVSFFRHALPVEADDTPVVHHGGGGLADAVFPSRAWRVERSELVDWATLRLEGAHGRSSNKDLPIFIATDAADTRGTAFVAGYSGHVVNTVLREADYRSVVVESFIEGLQVRLPPRARVRLGSMLVLPYEGDLDAGRNLLRRTLREHICPRPVHPVGLPGVPYAHWFGIESDFTAASLLREADMVAAIGAEAFEADAAVFAQGTHPHYGAGNWGVENPRKFPDGLKAFADAVRAKGMRFGLWFEPETVEAGTRMDREHPEWLIKRPAPNDRRHLLDFSHPEAVDCITRLIGDVVERYGVKWSRVDSNLDPDEYWATIADPGERGYRELRHWEGWYRFLDALRARFPDLHLEGCSSGGRRIDLEMLKRSHTFWISDNTAFAATVHQNIGGANHWLPSHLINMEAVKYLLFPATIRPYSKVGDETFSDFWLLSLFGGSFGLGGPHSAYPAAVNERFRRFVARYKQVRRFLNGDFYPLLPQPRSVADWDAWQFHDPDTGAGMVLVFRMRGGPDRLAVRPRALDPARSYRLAFFPAGRPRRVFGRDLARHGLPVRLSAPYGALLIEYTPVPVPARARPSRHRGAKSRRLAERR
jgi:alpha-galactosidase